jgi:surface antigen
MKTLLLSSVLALSLSGCFMPSGINPTLGCSPITGCQQKDFYLPGKGYWAPKQPMLQKKSTYTALGGAAIGATLASDPVSGAIYGVVGLVVGYIVGDTIDKVDQIHAAMAINYSFNNNTSVTWQNPRGNFIVKNTPTRTTGSSTKPCREFITDIIVNGKQKQMRGTACLTPKGEWEMKEVY